MTDDKRADKDLSQLEKFKNAARELECDDDEKRFKERVGRLVKPSEKGGQSHE